MEEFVIEKFWILELIVFLLCWWLLNIFWVFWIFFILLERYFGDFVEMNFFWINVGFLCFFGFGFFMEFFLVLVLWYVLGLVFLLLIIFVDFLINILMVLIFLDRWDNLLWRLLVWMEDSDKLMLFGFWGLVCIFMWYIFV